MGFAFFMFAFLLYFVILLGSLQTRNPKPGTRNPKLLFICSSTAEPSLASPPPFPYPEASLSRCEDQVLDGPASGGRAPPLE